MILSHNDLEAYPIVIQLSIENENTRHTFKLVEEFINHKVDEETPGNVRRHEATLIAQALKDTLGRERDQIRTV